MSAHVSVGRRRSRHLVATAAIAAAMAVGMLGRVTRADSAPSASATAAGVGVAAFTKGPFLQSLGTTGVTVKVELQSPGALTLDVYEAGGTRVVATKSSTDPSAFHALRAEGLTPGTSYDYRVTTGAATSPLGHFATAPTESKPFRFLVYGDSRSDEAAHTAVVRRMAAAPGDFLINTGDMVMSGADRSDWQTFFEIERALLRDRCVFASVGNHELARGNSSGEVAFLRYFASSEDGRDRTRLYGSFRWSNTRFYMLNAMDTWTGADREWLRGELDRVEPDVVHRIAVLHHGPFSSGPHGGNSALAKAGVVTMMRDKLVDLVLAGHDHHYERGAGDGLKYIVSGGAGAPLYPRERRASQTRTFESAHHFVEVAVDGDSVKIVARRASGGEIEACGFRGDGGWDCDAASEAAKSTAPPAAAPAPQGKANAAACGCSVPGERGEGRGDAFGVAIAMVAAVAALRRATGTRTLP